MAKRYKKIQRAQTGYQEFVIVAFVDDMEQARDYETLLRAEGIPVALKKQQERFGDTDQEGIVIMVPEEMLDEAMVVIESQDAYDDFYDFTEEEGADEDDEDFDSDVFEDEF